MDIAFTAPIIPVFLTVVIASSRYIVILIAIAVETGHVMTAVVIACSVVTSRGGSGGDVAVDLVNMYSEGEMACMYSRGVFRQTTTEVAMGCKCGEKVQDGTLVCKVVAAAIVMLVVFAVMERAMTMVHPPTHLTHRICHSRFVQMDNGGHNTVAVPFPRAPATPARHCHTTRGMPPHRPRPVTDAPTHQPHDAPLPPGHRHNRPSRLYPDYATATPMLHKDDQWQRHDHGDSNEDCSYSCNSANDDDGNDNGVGCNQDVNGKVGGGDDDDDESGDNEDFSDGDRRLADYCCDIGGDENGDGSDKS
ncbi:hypothetical protein EDB89DRAFT_2148491 [Lactarius sanguifluus]|nr:hypothetical protein EDB89DRAFT_2148491 [Lactarius sanguifluus]